jgi:enamine deaminase RidA (YjgF/YER057c/UK114 family)
MSLKYTIAAMVVAGLSAGTGHAADVIHVGRGDDFPISDMVIVPPGATTYYLAGIAAPPANPNAPKDSPEYLGDTKTQSLAIFNIIKDRLAVQKLGMGDIVMMRINLVGDPAKDGKMDFAGMMEAYRQFFGTKEQPNKPARITVQVAALAGPGHLVEIESIAAKVK